MKVSKGVVNIGPEQVVAVAAVASSVQSFLEVNITFQLQHINFLFNFEGSALSQYSTNHAKHLES